MQMPQRTYATALQSQVQVFVAASGCTAEVSTVTECVLHDKQIVFILHADTLGSPKTVPAFRTDQKDLV